MNEELIHPQKGSDETENPRTRATKRCTVVSALVNACLSVAQLLGGMVSGSQALIADGIHTLSDLASDFMVYFAAHHGSKAPDDDHPFGHQRFENMAVLILGILLCLVAVGMVYSGVMKLQDPSSIPVVGIEALGVAAGVLVVKESLFRYLLAVGKKVRSNMLIANAWHARSDAGSSLVVAVGVGGNLLGYPLLDPLAALIVGLMIGRAGFKFALSAMHDLTDRAASEEEIEQIRQIILSTSGVEGFHQLRTRKTGDLILVDVHVEVDGTLSVFEGHEIAEAVEDRIKEQHHVLDVLTHLDPVERKQPANE